MSSNCVSRPKGTSDHVSISYYKTMAVDKSMTEYLAIIELVCEQRAHVPQIP